jgi:hypothetical protein
VHQPWQPALQQLALAEHIGGFRLDARGDVIEALRRFAGAKQPKEKRGPAREQPDRDQERQAQGS